MSAFDIALCSTVLTISNLGLFGRLLYKYLEGTITGKECILICAVLIMNILFILYMQQNYLLQ